MIERICRSLRTSVLLLLALAAMVASPAPAEEDPLAGALFPPDLVLRHATELGLDAAQFSAIKEEVRKAQSYFLDQQLDLQMEVGKLRQLVEPASVDEAAALAQLDKVLALEREIKRAQIGLLVRIKNRLRPDQLQRLASIPTGR